MDLLRSCYSTEMRFWTDNALSIPVKWFWCDPGAKIFPDHHLFGSGNWASDRFNWDGPGEVLGAKRPYSKGEFIAGLLGEHFCGPVKGFTEGTVFPGVPLITGPDGVCACCVGNACGKWINVPRVLHARVTWADPTNEFFFAGMTFDYVFGFGDTGWYTQQFAAPGPNNRMRMACTGAGPFNLTMFSGEFGGGFSPNADAVGDPHPFVATFTGVIFQIAGHVGPLGPFDIFDLLLTE